MPRDTTAARGVPAPFTDRHVETLVRGHADPVEIAAILDSHRQPSIDEPGRRASKGAPVPIDARTLDQLVGGTMPTGFAERLQKAGKITKSAATKTRSRGRPRSHPPR